MIDRSAAKVATLAVFATAVSVGSCLMFVIEPMIAKMLLPAFGGTPNVWNTCVVFFQVLLIAGYLYAHVMGTRVPPKVQVVVHVLVIGIAAFLLPKLLPPFGDVSDNPIFTLIALLVVLVGAPFFAISTTTPLLSKWYSALDAAGSNDPYFLYAASNAGGMLGLISYPFLLEPNLRLTEQTQLVMGVYIVYAVAVLIAACCFYSKPGETSRANPVLETPETTSGSDASNAQTVTLETAPAARSYLIWLLLALVPQSLVLGFTTYVTSELSAIPLFWIVPLFIYLTSFVIAFSRMPGSCRRYFKVAALISTLLAAILLTQGTNLFGLNYLTIGLSVQLLALFLVCCACHMEIAARRPATRHLTGFYLTMSIGGVVGSSINSFIAPAVFTNYLEYPLMLVAAGILLSEHSVSLSKICNKIALPENARDWLAPVVVLVSCTVSWLVASQLLQGIVAGSGSNTNVLGLVAFAVVLQFLIPLFVCAAVLNSTRQMKIGVAILGTFMLLDWSASANSQLLQRRNFFGCLSIECNQNNNTCEFYHGLTMHGSESLDPDERGQPISYYYRNGPIGKLFAHLFGEPETLRSIARSSGESKESSTDGGSANQRSETSGERPDESSNSDPYERRREALLNKAARNETSAGPIAVLGLGTGTIASYAKKNQAVVYYEIDPEVVDLALNPMFFTYLFQARARGVDLKIVKGDGRLEIQKAPYGYFRAIVVDAFSSDSIPMHLITKEALATYRSKLRDDGIIVFNISNHFYDLKPVLQSLSADSGVAAFGFEDLSAVSARKEASATWVVFTSDKDTQATLRKTGWKLLEGAKPMPPWTDDFCSPLTVLVAPLS